MNSSEILDSEVKIIWDKEIASWIRPIKWKIEALLSLISETWVWEDKKLEIERLLQKIKTEVDYLWDENISLKKKYKWDNQDYLGDSLLMYDQISEKIRSWDIITSESLIEIIKIFFENHFPWVTIWIYRYIKNQWGFTDYETKIDWSHRQKVLREEDLDGRWDFLNQSVVTKKFQYTVSDDWVISWSMPLTQNDELYSLYLYFEKKYEEWVDIGEMEKRFYVYIRIVGFIIEQELKNIRNLYRDTLTWCQTKDYFNKHREFRNYSAIAIDLDKFKEINDKYWHSWWDDVLKAFWVLLQSCIRKGEWDAIRLSWDEFCVLIKNTNASDNHMKKILERLEKIVSEWKTKISLKNIENGEIEEVNILFSKWVCVNTNENKLSEVYKAADDDLMRNKSKEWAAYRVEDALKHLPPHIQLEIIYSVIRWLKGDNLHDCKTCEGKTIKKAE